jgi:hypothetical protein
MEDWEKLRSLESRMSIQEQRMTQIELHTTALTDAVSANTESLKEFIVMGQNLKIGLRLIGYLEKIAAFVIKIGAALAVVWAAWKFIVREAIAASFRN